MTEEPICWIDHDTLRVPRHSLEKAHDSMPPGVEARVLNILREARFENIMLNVGDGPFNVTETDLEDIAITLDVSGALWRMRPATADDLYRDSELGHAAIALAVRASRLRDADDYLVTVGRALRDPMEHHEAERMLAIGACGKVATAYRRMREAEEDFERLREAKGLDWQMPRQQPAWWAGGVVG